MVRQDRASRGHEAVGLAGQAERGCVTDTGKVQPARHRGHSSQRPVSRRQDRPNAILWLLRNHPELKDAQIMRLVGTTKSTIAGIRDRTHWNAASLTPLDPVTLGLCSQIDLDFEVQRAAKDRPAVETVEGGQTLLPAELSTAPEPAERSEPFGSLEPQRKPQEEEKLDVDSVFAKLKQLKRPVEDEQ